MEPPYLSTIKKSLVRLFAIIVFALLICGHCLAAESDSPSIRIAFSAEHEGGLYILDYFTSQIRQVDVGLLNIGNLAYSQTRNFLAFEGSKEHGEVRSLYLLDLTTNKKERIFKSLEDFELYRPRFDPTGQFLYAINYFRGIYRYSFAKKDWTSVPVNGVSSINPQGLSFSKSGEKVAISPGNFQGFLIGTIKDGTIIIKKHMLTNFDSCTSPRWVGEDVLIFAGRKVAGLQFLWKLDLVSNKVTQLTFPPVGSRDFITLSKDEKTIVFTGTSEKLEWRLWKISADGLGLKQLTKRGKLSSHLSPVWIE